jgi:hypothetical protein
MLLICYFSKESNYVHFIFILTLVLLNVNYVIMLCYVTLVLCYVIISNNHWETRKRVFFAMVAIMVAYFKDFFVFN